MGIEGEKNAWKRLERAWPRRGVESMSLEPDSYDALCEDPDEVSDEWYKH